MAQLVSLRQLSPVLTLLLLAAGCGGGPPPRSQTDFAGAEPSDRADVGETAQAHDEVHKDVLLPPGPGNPRNSEGSFVLLNDGRLMFVYTHFTGGGDDHDAAYLAARFSADGGRTWTQDDLLVVPNEGGMNVMSVSLLRLSTGEIALFYLQKNSLEDTRPVLRLSADEGKTWSEPSGVIPDREIGYYVLNNDRVVQIKGGRLVAPVSQHNSPGGKWSSYGHILAYLSDDNGRTWRRGATVLKSSESLGVKYQEPGVVELKDGRLLMFIRTDARSQYYSFSADGGDTWSDPRPSGITSPLSPASVKRIPRTGDLLLVWNNNGLDSRRTPFNVAVSTDEGETWHGVKVLEDDPGGWYCYTAITFVDDRVLLGHVAGNRLGGLLNTTQITSFSLDWLYRRTD